MEPRSTDSLAQFLAPTPLCDSDHARVRNKAKELAGGRTDPTEVALSIFYFVRDKISFGLYHCDAKASKTLDHRVGFCMTKTNLQMALLRAAGIPSRCHLVQLPKEVNQEYVPTFVMSRLPALIVHPFCECYLHGRWIACDSVADDAFYRGMINRGHLAETDLPSIDWDGRTDFVFPQGMIEADLGTFPSWDEGIKEAKKRGGVPPSGRVLAPIVFAMMNRRVREIRASGS